MHSERKQTVWHGFAAIGLENSRACLKVIPELGARLVSLVDKVTDREWLVQPEQSRPARKLPYGEDFNSTTQGGWDEMFPTLLPETYPVAGKYADISLPDHGELWTANWELDAGADHGIVTAADGIAIPYRIIRKIDFLALDEVLFSYELRNTGPQTLHYIWAAHPQFHAPAGTKIVLPPQVDQVVKTLPLEWGPEWGAEGTINPWPHKTLDDGTQLAADTVRSVSAETGRKVYIQPQKPISWAGLVVHESDSSIWLAWDRNDVPYCGIWIDEGFLNSVPSVAIEPTTGYYDSLTKSWQNQRLSSIRPGDTKSWNLTVQLKRANQSPK